MSTTKQSRRQAARDYLTGINRRHTFVFLFALACFRSDAEAVLDPGRALSQFVQQSWHTEQGLPQNSVTASAQTGDGYMWFGTEGGLARYDGFRFSTFDKSNTPQLHNNLITALLSDRNGALWVGTHGGGLAYYRDGHFQSFPQEQELARYLVLSLHEDQHGTLWIGTQGSGLLAVRNGKLQRFTARDGLPSDSVFAITSNSKGEIWIGTQNGVGYFTGGHWQSIAARDGATRGGAARDGLGTDEVRSLCFDATNSLLVGTHGGGLYRYDGALVTRVEGLSGTLISSLYADSTGAVWIGTLEGGLDRLAPSGHVETFTKKDGFSAAGVWSISQDHSGTLWIGATDGGLISLRQGLFTSLTSGQGLASDTTLAIYQDKAANIWIGSDQGLTRWSDKKATRFTIKDGLPDNLIFSVAEDAAGTLWVGTRNGLARMTGAHFQKVSTADGLPDARSILCTYADRKGVLWVGTRGGLSRFDGKRFFTYSGTNTIGDKPVLSLYQDAKGTLWIGTDGSGLVKFAAGQFQTLNVRNGLSSNIVYSITGDPDGTLWLGTEAGGLSRLKSGKFTNYSKTNGLIDDSIYQIIDDGHGALWMSSNRGVASVTRSDLNQFADGRLSQITSTVYGLADGMKSAECNGGFQPAGWKTNDGRLWFPTTKGVAIASLGVNRSDGIPLSVLVESARAGNTEIVVGAHDLRVPPNQKQLSFDFTATGSSAPDKLRFRYLLDGFDKEWIEAGTRRTAYYTNIPPGTYRFRVSACIGARCTENGPGLAITFEPAFYETKLFLWLLVCLAGGSGLGFHRLNVKHLKQREKKLARLVSERTRELRESRDQLEVRVEERTNDLSLANRRLAEEVDVRRKAEEKAEAASHAKSQFLANMSHELRTPINGIMGMTELALTTTLNVEQHEYLDTIKSSADSLLALVSNILNFSTIEAQAIQAKVLQFELRQCLDSIDSSLAPRALDKGLQYQAIIQENVPKILLGDPDRLSQLLSHLLENSIRFTNTGGISLAICVEEMADTSIVLHFAVADTGIGIPEDKQRVIFEAFSQADNSSTRQFGGSGLGLAIASQLVKCFDGRIWVESEVGVGSTFHFLARFQLPTAVPELTAVRESYSLTPHS